MNINSNFGNLTSVIKSSFETTPIKEANQAIEELDKKLIKVNKDGVTVDPNKFIADYMKTSSLKEMQNDLNKNKETINQVKQTTKQATTELEKMSNVNTNNLNKELDKTDKKIKQITNTSSKSNFGQSLKTALGIGTVALGIRKAVGFFKEATTESIDFVETQNLFNVSMGKTVDQYGNLDRESSKYYTKAMAFQEKLSDKLKINIEESMEYQALFNAMSKSMRIGDEPSYKISENFTKLGYDLSSLYNIDPENAMQKLRAGLSGQTKPLRDLGLDITQQSLEPLLDELGIERSTKKLSQAEKMIARYIVVLRQASLAHGDFAKTMDSPANQLRIFNAQLTAFKRNIGNLWQGLLGNIIPYVNAIMMVINELLKMVAKLFGFKIESQNISAGIGADDLADDLGTASGKAKELKKQLMGFDEINNITLPDKASGGSGASVGGIDQRLLDAMKEYDNMMDKVKSKATDIRDKIMEWLGFTKKVNPLTGEITWELGQGNTNLKKILNIAKLLVGLYVGAKLLKLIGYVRTLKGVLVGTVAPTTSFQNGLALVGTGLKNTGTWLKIGADQFKAYIKSGENVGIALAKTGQGMLDLIPKTVRVAGGIAGLVASCGLAYSSMQDLSNGSIGTGEAIAKLTGSIAGATASGAMLGSVFGPVGTAVGALTGLVLSAGSAMLGYNNNLQANAQAIENLKKKNEQLIASHEATIESINKNKDSQLINLQVAKEQIDSMKDMIDSNGKVKDSYKSRVEYILNDVNKALGTEFTLTGNQITQNGKVVKSYDDLVKKTDEYIKKKEEQIKLEVYQETYKEELKHQLELQKQLKEAEQKTADTLAEKNKFIEDGSKKLIQYRSGIDGIQAARANTNYENAKKEEEEIRKQLDKTGKSIKTAKEDWLQYYDDVSDNSKEKGKEINETTMKTLTQQTKTVEDLTPESIEAWKNLSSKSATEYEQQLLQTDETTQMVLDTIVGNVDVTSPNYIEKWAKMANESSQKYNLALSKLPEETKAKILASTIAVTGMTETTKTAYRNLSEEGKKAFNNILAKMEPEARQKIQNAITAVDKKATDMRKAGENVAQKGLDGAKQKVNDKNSGASKIGSWFVSGFLTSIKGGGDGAFWAGFNLVKRALAGGNEAQKTGSPAKETIKMGNFFTEGYIIGLKKQQEQVRKVSSGLVTAALKELNKFDSTGFTINPNDFKIDTNQFIDYGQISGAIATQSDVEVSSSLPQQVKEAVIEGMRNSKIKVEVEGKADKNAIFQVVQAGADEYYMQTGEPAFGF